MKQVNDYRPALEKAALAVAGVLLIVLIVVWVANIVTQPGGLLR